MPQFSNHATDRATKKSASLNPDTGALFVKLLLRWFNKHGRKTLPWQKNKDPYAIWVSEIMLQQTQVETVIPYYQKFMAQFPNIKSLAQATQEEVMTYWAGLGYYARARNLHGAAQKIEQQYKGRFPMHLEQVVDLPGIGRSTAGAILAFSDNQPHPILDGNVKRVLTRFFAISGYPSKKAVENQLWQLAIRLTPTKAVADYTQAIMDLGATLCMRHKPNCNNCPLRNQCQAFATGDPTQFPQTKPKKQRPLRKTQMLVLCNEDGSVLLIKRPPSGIWGGLWSFPETTLSVQTSSNNQDLKVQCQKAFGVEILKTKPLEKIKHSFTHFELEIVPILCQIKNSGDQLMDAGLQLWYNRQSNIPIAVPTAIKKIFKQLPNSSKRN